MSSDRITDAKARLRHKVWQRLDSVQAGRSGPVNGKIPNFHGANRAAEHLTAHPRWQKARVVKANPDKAQTEVRLGKGAGYSDIEMGLLAQAGLVSDDTLIVTTVHELQVLDEPIPEAEHDVSVDLIVTPDGAISCPPRRRPSGISWEDLSEQKIAAIPILQELRELAASDPEGPPHNR
ncbi:5-formyltetrahydrofolate cyclo-ligase [Nocardiopsis alba]|uniref:5-formyltetrahydrofolate cyclo-ligase n=1 Tax=Nocardiopsis alba TaxID=53437 RepID=A0A7K2IYC0_9ACTN|nr:5-formyltetrahydrofolate cyclo-ligase [Nocardiopsis alba]MYR34824.1 5-formyltetrahydrofolate cyclo-ligase [Nocardiopsis alba]